MRRLPISVCLIVKNEELYLDDCLKSVKDWVNEIIVVDTGSTDKTVQIAKDNGAKVSYFEWIGDFAAARNESLNKATNPFILQLDADEEMIESTISWFEDEYPYIKHDGYQMLLHNLRDASSDEIAISHRLIRFYRNHPKIRYRFKIHENIVIPSNNVSFAKAEILHKGYGKDVNNQNKVIRNKELLLKAIEENPQNPLNHFYISQSYSTLGMGFEAYKASVKALKLGITFPIRCHVYRSIFSYLADTKNIAEFSLMEKTLISDAHFPEIVFYRATLLNKMKEEAAAKQFYLEFIHVCENPPEGKKLGNEDFIVLPNYTNALTCLAILYQEENRIEQALECMYKAIQVSPLSNYIYSMIARNEVVLNRKENAINVLEKAIGIFESQYTNLHQKTLIGQYKTMITKIKEAV